MKSVLITGCSSGVGLCIAKGLKEKGYRVFASARSPGDVKNLKNLAPNAKSEAKKFGVTSYSKI